MLLFLSPISYCYFLTATMGTVSYATNNNGGITVSWTGANLGSGSGQIIYSQCLPGGVTTLMNVNSCPGATATCFTSGAGSKEVNGLTAGVSYSCRAHIVSGGSSVANVAATTKTAVSGNKGCMTHEFVLTMTIIRILKCTAMLLWSFIHYRYPCNTNSYCWNCSCWRYYIDSSFCSCWNSFWNDRV